MAKESLVLLGGGGHCKSCIDVIESTDQWQIAGILEKTDALENAVLNYPILGDDSEIDNYIIKGHHFLVTVGQISSPGIRDRLYRSLKAKNAKLATIVSSVARVSKHAQLGQGTIVHHFSFLNASSTIGENCIINSRANIEHDTVIGNNSHISTGAILNGNVVVGNNCFIGSGAIVSHGVIIGDDVIIGAGSLVLNNIESPGTYIGIPAKKK